MEQNLEKRGKTALTKSNVAEFVHDMKELELKEFTLRKLLSSCNNERKNIEATSIREFKTAETNVNVAKKTVEEKEYDYQRAKNWFEEASANKANAKITYKPYEPDDPPELPTWLGVILVFIPFIGWLILVIISIVLSSRQSRYYDRYAEYKKDYKEYEKYLEIIHDYEKAQNQYDNAKKQLDIAKQQYEIAKNNLSKTAENVKTAQAQMKKLVYIGSFFATHIIDLQNMKKKLYELNIVPPDYRTLDCLIEFDQMFRNDLVDTMRQAVMIYEERVFRGELIRGIDNIYNMLGQLTSAMRNIESTLYSIRNNVHVMTDDIYKIASSTEQFQEQMLSESRAARYATEAVQTSTERCEWYLEKQYLKS